MQVGTLVTDTDINKDLGIVVGHHTDIYGGTFYNKVKWLTGRFVGEIDHIETECLEEA